MPMSELTITPEPPYYAVVFTSKRTEGDNGYGVTAAKMEELVAKQPGFLGVESARDADGLGITVSYWESLAAIKGWKEQMSHKTAQDKGKSEWYRNYAVRVCRVERDYFL
jgi:heme-degrading monooxygenase HmoA